MNIKTVFTRIEIINFIRLWIQAWNNHDLEKVMLIFDNDAEFIHWDSTKLSGYRAIRYAWLPWFKNHENFNFKIEKLYIDEKQQAVTMYWSLNWLSKDDKFKGIKEQRKGIDCLFFKNRKLIKKHSFSHTATRIN